MTCYLFLLLFLAKTKAELKWREFGTGLNEKIAIPLRHFFVEVTDENGKRVDARDLEGNLICVHMGHMIWLLLCCSTKNSKCIFIIVIKKIKD